ncbi:Predicted DNA-binding transcriptional regulator YafY, contains an HTH and WYL domains [Nocardiopsis flavescens]|uniref:Predicted DNA-binding transcriptional regulator YafY, contains an HTH and WYL domains n=1 Tax=Nocardiopsis flavescens TaxID=758803 RepID=A0A1M6AYD2_9ACTN|nr:YafY family protein [Nocardiopsis flavescens]SHI41480.1 Predicted DNA-binding transcriptional regulator YafY, contains an HTH and WYL domains [Nocardiopsis flavescens]
MSTTTSSRLLRLLSLLQTRKDWPGGELAERLEVSARTVRRDVDRLRELGYPIRATMGTGGGYQLGVGAALPPLLLDDEEAVAVAVGLRTAAQGGVRGIEETSVRALAKLLMVLPSRLRRRVEALGGFTVPVPGGGPVVDADVLALVAGVCRDGERLRFDYERHDGTVARRVTEPHRLVSRGRLWYLVAWDNERDDWRTFRVDRMRPLTPTGPRVPPRDPPAQGVAAYLAERMNFHMWPHRARVRLFVDAEEAERRGIGAYGRLEPADADSCVLEVAGDSLRMMACYLAMLDVEMRVEEPGELRAEMAALSERLRRAAG